MHFHFTPTYSSWLNQIELWFGKIEREMLARGIVTSVADLRHKLLQYIRLYNQTCKPIAWAYNDPTRRIRAIKTHKQFTSMPPVPASPTSRHRR